jgi:Na+/H+ antiporter NhaC
MKLIKKISKPTLIIITLFLLNLVVFAMLSSNIKKQDNVVTEMTTSQESKTYFKSGVDVLNWSYTLYKYFKR